ncbi:uronate isomerase [Capsulimonas corticalis]|uniref:Uronate isomerase n=1 Tax=Capsulimonas corticalis TaxID=2219043 RepID=A0A402D5X1_9BACT|nr:glucuronate isomerase [Capsulimonas corticalis]BDI32511.1 uronate isomerase [Capsulimonas corticalis]
MSFIHEDFLLQTQTARLLYHQYAADQPILDYHNHLPPDDIAGNRRFNDLAEIWLAGDHYKWRAMRANGVEERYCTGDADPYEKFLAWAKTVPHTLRNPIYHWTHLELKRYFGIDELLNEKTAPAIWERANAQLQTSDLTTWGILRKFQVAALCTTDDPTGDLAAHRSIADSDLPTRVYPAFRPDKALAVDQPEAFNAWLGKLEAISDTQIGRLPDLLDALDKRHRAFHEIGSRLSDHGLARCYADFPSEAEAAAIFDRARAGQAAGADDHAKFASYLMLFFGRLDAKRGWTKQLHLGALRSVNTRGLQKLGPDTGFDSIGDWPQAASLGAYLDRLQQEDALPKVILYNNNPNDNYVLATMAGNFQDGSTPGKIQFGSGWWFLDTKEGIEWQLNTLSNTGLLSRFVGMLTDSRSFMSYPRHEYFRRVLCNVIGREIESGEIPGDEELVGPMIENICFGNAKRYLALDIPEASGKS